MENKTTKKNKLEMFKQYLKGGMALAAIASIIRFLAAALQSGMSRNFKMGNIRFVALEIQRLQLKQQN